jgi:hypothetical protein
MSGLPLRISTKTRHPFRLQSARSSRLGGDTMPEQHVP